jgi:hypothetical protein
LGTTAQYQAHNEGTMSNYVRSKSQPDAERESCIEAVAPSKLTGADLAAARFLTTNIKVVRIPPFNRLAARARRKDPMVAAKGDDDLMSQPQV